MPTGYTAGLLDGTIKTFPEYAKLCLRAFGAAIHMRDEPLSTTYQPREVFPYHSEKLKDAKFRKEAIEAMSDDEIISKRKGDIEDELNRLNKYIIECGEKMSALTSMLEQVEKWEPPTPEHVEYKKFMESQIIDTMKHDGNSEYWQNEKKELEHRLHFLKANEIRKEYIEKAQWDIDYHTKEYENEVSRVEKANGWVNSVLETINN